MTESSKDVIGSGRVAVVTGAASGIGRALAEAFAAAGSSVVLADLDSGEAETVAAGIRARGGDAESMAVNVADAAPVDGLPEATLARHGRVHVACNNPGVSPSNTLPDQTLADWRWPFYRNLSAASHAVH